MAAITGEIGSNGQLNHRKVQSREEKLEAPACVLLRDYTTPASSMKKKKKKLISE